MKRFFIFLISAGFMVSSFSHAQEIRITGNVSDSQTGEPVPFASIGISGQYRGTSSNTNGDFLLKVDSLPLDLTISHISYQKKMTAIRDTAFIRIQLDPAERLLKEVVIEEKGDEEYAYKLIENALIVTTNKSRDWNYGLAFYRQTSRNEDDHSGLYEIFYDTRYTATGIIDWAIQEGRYAMDTHREAANYVFNKNFTLLSRLVTMVQPDADNFIMPVNENVRDLYHLNISELRDVQDRQVAVVSFSPMEHVTKPALEGEILIDINSYEILKLAGTIRNDQVDIISLADPKGSWKNYELHMEAAFKPVEDALYLDYIRLSQTFDYYLNDEFSHPVNTEAFLTWYEYYEPEKFKRLGGQIIRYSRSDREELDKVGYNRSFWADNPIVKRTPVEEEIIASFEAANAFGSIYLNDREQILLEKDLLENDPFIRGLNQGLRASKLPSSGEKVFLHLDKPFYAAGETIWLSANLVNLATHRPAFKSSVLYIDLISPGGDILLHKRLHLVNAHAAGHFDIPEDQPTGPYRIRAYTEWMKNYDPDFFFDRKLNIYNATEVLDNRYISANETFEYEVIFFPEGGDLIYGIASQMAFKAVDQAGNGIDIEGHIVDQEDNRVAEIKTRHEGMGSVFLIPQPGNAYQAVVRYNGLEKRFDLPQPRPSGYIMTVNNLKENVIQIMIKSTPDLIDSEFYLIGQMRGVIYFTERNRISRGVSVLTIPKSKLPSGVMQITLFNPARMPKCERLCFINNYQPFAINIEPESPQVKPGEDISFAFQFKDPYGKPQKLSKFSIAVTDPTHVAKNGLQENILNYLLLSSDLKGHIHQPGSYFLDDSRETQIALDLLMLTHGWRRFTWKRILDGQIAETSHSHERGINTRGIAYKKRTSQPIDHGIIHFISMDETMSGYWTATTDGKGRFEIPEMIIPDTLKMVAQGLDDKGENIEVTIKLDSLRPYPAGQAIFQKYPAPVDAEVIRYLNRSYERNEIFEAYDFTDRILLEEIVVEAERYQTFYGAPDYAAEITDENRTGITVTELIQGRFPGVWVSGGSILIRGVGSMNATNEPLILLDGMPLVGDSMSSAINTINSIPVQWVKRIEVSKSPTKTAVYGVRGANGIIAIFTYDDKELSDIKTSPGDYEAIRFPGLSLVREFYTPAPANSEGENTMPDMRTTLYWEPVQQTDMLGRSEIGFPNSDYARSLQVEIQGITEDGRPFYFLENFGAPIINND